jgi:RNA polymerase sigma-70 factor, ECF subfamily
MEGAACCGSLTLSPDGQLTMDQKTEAEIVARVLKGDRQAYALLVEEYKNPIYNLACRMTNNLQDVDDLTQEIFIRAYQKLQQFDQNKRFFTWIYTVGINLIRNHLKKKAQDIIVSSGVIKDCQESRRQEHEHSEDKLLLEETIIKLGKTMQKLPVDLREAVILKYYQNLTFGEVAEVTGVSLSAIKMRVYRGLDQLKRLMEADGGN